MNRIFKSVWNQATGAWVAVSEAANTYSGNGAPSARSLVRSQPKKSACVRQMFSLADDSDWCAPDISSFTLSKVAWLIVAAFSLGMTTVATAQTSWSVFDEPEFSDALQNAANGDTIRLTGSIDIGGSWTAPAANTLIFDLGNHTLSGAALQFLTGGGDFTFGDGSSAGKVSGSSIVIGNAANAVAVKLTGTTNIASTGAFSVTGAGSMLDLKNSSSADVTGTLTVNSGGKVTLDGANVNNKLTAGAVTVTDAGSTLSLQGLSSATTTGALSVDSGGKVTLDGANVNNKLTAGAVTVTGAGSTLDLQGASSADVTGALTVNAGGTVALDGTANVGGNVTVSGVQNVSSVFHRSTLWGNGVLNLTDAGVQTLDFNTGALVRLDGAPLTLASNKTLTANGVYSSGATTYQTEVTLDDLTVQGTINVTGGAKLSVDDLVVENGNNVFKVDGVVKNTNSGTLYHSELAVAGNMDIGTTNAKGMLEVSNGAKASVGGDVVVGKGNEATVTLTSVPSTPQTQLTATGNLVVAEGANAELTIENGALFSANTGTGTTTTVGKNAGTTGTINLSGYGGASGAEQARLQTGDITLGDSGNAIVDIQGGGLLSTGNTILAKQAGSSATVTINAPRSSGNYAWKVGGNGTDPGYSRGEANLNVTDGWVNVAGFLSMGTLGNTANATFTGSGAELNMAGGTFRNEGSTNGTTGNQKGITLIQSNAYVSGSGNIIAGDHFEVNNGVVAPGSRWMYDFDRTDSSPSTNALTSLGHLTIESRNASKTTVFTNTTFQTELDRGDTTVANLSGLSDQVTVNGNLQLDNDFKVDISRVLDGRYLLVNTTNGGTISGYLAKDLTTAGDFDINLNGKTLKGNERVDYISGKVYTSLESSDKELYLNLESKTKGNVVTHWTGNAGTTWDMVARNFESATTAGTEQFLDGDIVVFDDKWMNDPINGALSGSRAVDVTLDLAKYKSNVTVPEVRVFDEGATGTIFSWDGGSIYAYDSSLYTTLDRGDPNARNPKTPTGSLVKIGTGTLEINNANEFYGGIHLGGNVHDYDASYANQAQGGGIIEVKNDHAFGTYDSAALHPYKGMIFVHEYSQLHIENGIELQNRFYIDPGKTLDIVFDGTFAIKGNNALLDSGVNGGKGGGIFIGDSGVINYFGSGGMEVSNNKANKGGGIYTEIGYNLPVATELSGNYASQEGGAVYAENKFELQSGSTISGNAARGEGGGIYIDNKDGNTETFTLHGNTTVTNNLAGESAKGGGVYVAGGRQLVIATGKSEDLLNNVTFEGGDVWFSGNKVGAVFDPDHPDDLSKINVTNAKANALHLAGNSMLTISGPYNTYFYDPITGDANAKVVINGVAANTGNTTASHNVATGQTGTVVFRGTSAYLGSTEINDGATFRVENDAIYGSTGGINQVFALNNTSILTGQGTINARAIKLDGIVDLDTASFSQPVGRDGSGVLSFANTQGVLALTGAVSVADTANWKLNLTNTTGSNPTSDLIQVTGAANFTGANAGKKLRIDTDDVVRGKYAIMTATGNISGYNTDARKSDATVYTSDPGALAGIDLSTSQLTSASDVNLGRLKATSYADNSTATRTLYLDIIGRNRHVTASTGGIWTYDNTWTFGGADKVTPTGANTGGTVSWSENDTGPATNAYLDGDMVTLTGGNYQLGTAVRPVDLYVTTGNVNIAGGGGITTFSTAATSGTTITTNAADNDYGIIGYTGKLYKYDSGTLAFTNTAANTFTGGIVVGKSTQNGGTIEFSNGNQLGVGTGAFMVFDGSGTLMPTADTTLTTNMQIADSKSAIIDTNNHTLTLNNTVTDKSGVEHGQLVKEGGGTLILSGTNTNTFTGGTLLNEGTIAIGKNTALGIYTGAGNAGVVEMTDDGTVLTTNGATARVIQNRIIVADGLAGSGTTITTGGGNLTMNGAVGFNDVIHVGNGSNLNLGSTQNIFVNGGVTGNGTLNKTASGIVQIAADSAFSGTTNVNAGTLRVTNGKTFGNGSASSSFNVDSSGTLAGGGTIKADTITVNGIISTDKAVLTSSIPTVPTADRFGTLTLDGNVTLDGFTFKYNADTTGVPAVDPNEAASWSGDLLKLTGSSALLKQGTLDLQGTISSGKYLLVDSQNTIALDAGKVLDGLNFSNGALDVYYAGNVLETNDGPRGIYSLAFADNIANVNNAQIWLDINRNSLTMDWSATGGNKLWHDNNWMSQQQSSAPVPVHAEQFNDGDYVNFENNSGTAEIITVASDVMTSGFTVTGNDDFTFDGTGGIRVAGQIEAGIEGIYLTGTGGTPLGTPTITVDGKLQKTGAGTLTFENTGGNKFEGGIFINEGTLAFTQADQLDTTNVTGTIDRGINFIDDATLRANDDVAALGNKINIANGKTATLDVVNGKHLNISGRIDEVNNTGSASIDKVGDGRLTLSGSNNDYAGATTVTAGTLAITNAGAVGGTSGVSVASNANFALDYAADGALGKTISGAGNVLKEGNAKVTLTGNNTYSGSTTVIAGTLAINNAGAVGGTSGVTVDGGAAFELAYTADGSFAKDISGSGKLVKTGDATVTIDGAANNTYSGGTEVSDGRLVLQTVNSAGSGAVNLQNAASLQLDGAGTFANALEGAGGLIVNNDVTIERDNDLHTGEITINSAKTLTFEHAADVAMSNHFSGGGNFAKDGTETLTLNGITGWTGNTFLNQGNLTLDGSQGGARLTSNLTSAAATEFRLENGAVLTGSINAGSSALSDVFVGTGTTRWEMTDSSNVNNLALDGNLQFSSSGTFKTLTVANSLSGNGDIYMNTNLKALEGDKIVTNETSGNHVIHVTNRGGSPRAPGQALELIDITDQSKSLGNFTLSGGKVDAGAYRYMLVQGSALPTTLGADANNWFLYNNGALSDLNKQAQNGANSIKYATIASLNNLRKRLGELRDNEHDRGNVWMRAYGKEYELNMFDAQDAKQNIYGFEIGSDRLFRIDSGRVYLGAMVGAGRSDMDSRQQGSIDSKSVQAGAYATWMFDSGTYVDLVGRYFWFKHDYIFGGSGNQEKADNRSTSFSADIEVGHKLDLSNGWFLGPQAELTWIRGGRHELTTDRDTNVVFDQSNALIGRAGLSLGKQIQSGSSYHHFYGRIDRLQNISESNDVIINGERFSPDKENGSWIGTLGMQSTQKNSNFYVELETGLGNSDIKQKWGINVGARWSF